jgi:hypothetical protein
VSRVSITARLPKPGPLGWAVACVALAVFSLAIPSAPAYDPWSWIVWGREVLAGDLQTEGAISWKPLPVLFTAPFSLFGAAAPDLWLLTARAAAFGAVLFAVSIGFRLAGRLGGFLSGGLLLMSARLWEPVLLGFSEGGVVFCVLAAVDAHLAGRVGLAFVFGVGAGLLRPEAWLFLGLYGIWLSWRCRTRLRWVAPGLALIPALWFLPELWGSGSLWRGAERAQHFITFGPALEAHPWLTVLEKAVDETPAVVLLGLLVGLATAALRAAPRDALVPALGLASLGVAWLGLVAGMTELGFSGHDRYLVVPVAIAHVLAGLGFAWAVAGLLGPARRRPGLVAVACLAGLALAGASRVVRWDWPPMLDRVERNGVVADELDDVIARAGGKQRLEACGSLYTGNFFTPQVAWTFGRHLAEVGGVPRSPATVLRVRGLPGQPLQPPRDALARVRGRRVIARSRYWQVEVACRRGRLLP